MLKNTFILIILFGSIVGFAQTGYSKSDSLLLSYEFEIFNTKNDTLKNNITLKKINVLISHNTINARLTNEIERVNFNIISDSVQLQHFLWNASIANLITQQQAKAQNYLNHYQLKAPTDTSIDVAVCKLIIAMQIDTGLVSVAIDNLNRKDSAFKNIACYNQLSVTTRNKKTSYQLASAIVPGLGMIALKKPLKGFTSLVLNAASVYATTALVKNNLYFNAVSWGFVLAQKFYVGGIKLTGKLYDDREVLRLCNKSKQCEIITKLLLEKYPLKFR